MHGSTGWPQGGSNVQTNSVRERMDGGTEHPHDSLGDRRSGTRCARAVGIAADEVTDWNQILVSALTATSTSPQNAGRIAAITHAAMFDAVNGIDRRYTPYFVTDEAPRGASRRAAAVQAAYVVLKTLLPAQASGLERQRDASIAAIRLDDRGVDRGIEWGQFVADKLLAERSTDGFPNGGVPDSGDTAVGKWRPQAGLAAVTPWLAVLTPFAMPSPIISGPTAPRRSTALPMPATSKK